MCLPRSNAELVLVTGVDGYLGSQLAVAFLDHGFNVRGTVESLLSSDDLMKTLAQYGKAGRFSLTTVTDTTTPTAFDEAVRDCHAIVLIPSPLPHQLRDPIPVIHTAIISTTSLLSSAIKNSGPQLKSIILISSIYTLISSRNRSHVFTEDDWNDSSLAECVRLGNQTSSEHISSASKAVAEQEFWSFQKDRRPPFAMTAVNPADICGPPIAFPAEMNGAPEDLRLVWDILSGRAHSDVSVDTKLFVDMRDLAHLVLWATQNGAIANRQRYIACGGLGSEATIVELLGRFDHAHRVENRAISRAGSGSKCKESGDSVLVDASKAVAATGKKWMEFEQSVLDAVKLLEKHLSLV